MSRFWFSVVSILCQKQNLGKENTEKIYFIAYLLFEITFKVYAINSVIYINILFIFRNHKKSLLCLQNFTILFKSHYNVGLCVYIEKLDGLGSGGLCSLDFVLFTSIGLVPSSFPNVILSSEKFLSF